MSQDPALEPPPAYVQANPALENLPDSAQGPSLLKYDIQKEVQETLVSLGDLKENMATVLRDYDTIVVLDDSGSMNTRDRWPAACRILRVLAEIIVKYDKDGMDLYFLNRSKNNRAHIRTAEQAMQRCPTEPSSGSTPIGKTLAKYIINPYLRSLRMRGIVGSTPKPINVIIITDGAPVVPSDDKEDVTDIIKKAAEVIKERNLPKHQIGFQFLQVGEDQDAKKWLEQLDGDKESLFPLDIVDTRPYNGRPLDAALVLSALIGAIHGDTDKEDASRYCRSIQEVRVRQAGTLARLPKTLDDGLREKMTSTISDKKPEKTDSDWSSF
ncbi:hypothetical protein EIP86_000308 [Pleurotus ostreatoroseus]|nr:hypothetical protein EIP86_000308 [Pleurotus ostreatoroseus]